MSQKKLDVKKLALYSSSSRQRNTTYSPNLGKHKQIGEYLLLSTIGRGTFSKVKLGLHIPTKQKVAIKILDKEKINDDSDIERIRREIHILSILRHPNIVQLYETITNDNNIYIIMEYVEGKDLFQYIYSVHHLTEFKASQLFRQLISCLEYIHKLGIVHRDIKPENILLNKNKNFLKLVDFGLSNTYEKDELIKTACGSPCYAAPEMISGKDYEGFYSDLWSCGVVLYCMLVGKLPFDDEDIKKLYHNIKIANYYMPNFLSINAQDLLRKILVTNPKRRIKLEELKRHPFFLMSEKTPMLKGIFVDNDEIEVDDEIVEKMREKYFNNDEDCNINYDIIVQNVKNNLHNKITTIYNLLYKSKYEKNLNDEYLKNRNKFKKENNENKNDNLNYSINYSTNKKNNNIDENYDNENEKSPSFAKINPKIDNDKIIGNDPEIKDNIQSLNKNDCKNSTEQNNENGKRYNIKNIKKLLFNKSNKEQNSENVLKNNEKENLSICNDNNEKRFNILVINNFMSEKESSQIDNFQNISSVNNKINPNNNKNRNAKIDKKNKTLKNNIRNKKEKAKSLITDNSNNSHTKEIYDNIILKRIMKNNKTNLNRIHSINYYKKKRAKSSTNNSKKIFNFTISINHTNNNINKNKKKDNINNNINKIQYNNKNNNFGINDVNIKPFPKSKKINFDLFNYNNYNSNNINAIRNENVRRHNYVLSKVKSTNGKNLNKSISFGNNKRNGTNKFKKYIKKLFEEESYSINNGNSKNKSINLSPLFHPNLEKNKDKKIFNRIITNNKNNKNLLLNIDSELSKLNKTNILDFYKANELKKSNSKNKNNNNSKVTNISIENNKELKNNIHIIKNINTNKFKSDFEEKMIKYMKQRFKNCQRKNNSKDKPSNLYIKLSYNNNNNCDKKSKSGNKSPNSIISNHQSEANSNKSYFKYNNKIIVNSNNLKYKFSNNSTKNNTINKNKKNKNNINFKNKKKNKNFLFAVDFSNVIKKNISRNKNNKNKNVNNNHILNNDLINNNINNNLGGTYISQEKQNMILNIDSRTTYHSKGKLKSNYGYEKIKYSPIGIIKKNKSNCKKKNISLNMNINEFNLMNHSKEKNFTSNNSKNKKKFDSYKIRNLNIIC